jgi:hypothetical protein
VRRSAASARPAPGAGARSVKRSAREGRVVRVMERRIVTPSVSDRL